ncbi:hypothetical protein SK128_026310 [Halocaridina rubra]|uniref:Chitin-binding type-2 domain-containing protein n=1 Tax=Halocaridina rubra TaxID=373956 RepID=A0AAN8WR62_HALRR
MKLAALSVVLFLMGLTRAEEQCSAAISQSCPFPDPPNPEFIADPTDCSAYCECSDGIAWRFHCAPGTLFDEVLKICNWADVVDCGSRPILTTTAEPGSDAPSSKNF